MNVPATTLADRIADRALVLIAAVNMLFLALFLLTAWLAMPAAAAAAGATCNGSDLLAKLKTDDPPAYAALEAGVAPPVVLESTHMSTLEFLDLDDLRAHAVRQ